MPFGAFLGAIAKAVIPALVVGAVKNKRDREAQKDAYNQAKKASANRFVDLRNAATKAGFNPLTALMGGGAPASPFMEPLLSNNFVGDALGRGLETAFNYDPEGQAYQKERQSLELEMMRQELELSKKQGQVLDRDFGYTIPQVETSTLVRPSSTPPLLSPEKEKAYTDWTGLDPIPTHIPMKKRDGSIMYVPNPDGPDMDQAAYLEGVNVMDEVSKGFGWTTGQPLQSTVPNVEKTAPLTSGFFGSISAGSTYTKKSQR